jgi:hypothetical protein
MAADENKKPTTEEPSSDNPEEEKPLIPLDTEDIALLKKFVCIRHDTQSKHLTSIV